MYTYLEIKEHEVLVGFLVCKYAQEDARGGGYTDLAPCLKVLWGSSRVNMHRTVVGGETTQTLPTIHTSLSSREVKLHEVLSGFLASKYAQEDVGGGGYTDLAVFLYTAPTPPFPQPGALQQQQQPLPLRGSRPQWRDTPTQQRPPQGGGRLWRGPGVGGGEDASPPTRTRA